MRIRQEAGRATPAWFNSAWPMFDRMSAVIRGNYRISRHSSSNWLHWSAARTRGLVNRLHALARMSDINRCWEWGRIGARLQCHDPRLGMPRLYPNVTDLCLTKDGWENSEAPI